MQGRNLKKTLLRNEATTIDVQATKKGEEEESAELGGQLPPTPPQLTDAAAACTTFEAAHLPRFIFFFFFPFCLKVKVRL